MLKTIKRAGILMIITTLVMTSFTACDSKNNSIEKNNVKAFEPVLDTQSSVFLEIAGFMGNFESLDQVVNDFNEYYPNVVINYEQNNEYALADYMSSNENVDIFMTSDSNVRNTQDSKKYVNDYCLDLSQQNIDTSAIDSNMIKACTVNDSLVRIPLARTMCGMVVNKTLLKKEGLSIPQTYEEFINACEVLKQKGYTPIQASENKVCSDMVLPMAMTIIGNNPDLMNQVNTREYNSKEAMRPVFEKLANLFEKGYCDYEVNKLYEGNNYDKAILRFFEGEVPFWICNTESVSGMKKRESKSEKYQESPFEYGFYDVPLGDEGVYVYQEAWYGFSINNKSKNIDYSVEFMRFLSTEKELNILAEIKGMPSVCENSDDSRYIDALNPPKVQGGYVYDGSIRADITSRVSDVANSYGTGKIESVEDALETLTKSR